MKTYAMITGAGGMVGSHMIDWFNEKKISVIGTYYKPTINLTEIRGKATLLECDVRYFAPVYDIIKMYQPEVIFHLAAQSYPTVSWKRPQDTMEVNVTGTINVFESILRVREQDSSYNPMVVVACSSAEYGNSLNKIDKPADEQLELLPLHPYGVSKVAQDLLAYQYYQNNKIRSIRARIFNTTGPRKTNDVCSDLTYRIVQMEKLGQKTGSLKVGNLETYRAITDVRDLVRALIALSEHGEPGEVYNISGESVHKISDVVEIIRKYTDLSFDLEVAPELLRPTDEKIICGNSQKLQAATGWKQTYSLEQTIKDMLTYWRNTL